VVRPKSTRTYRNWRVHRPNAALWGRMSSCGPDGIRSTGRRPAAKPQTKMGRPTRHARQVAAPNAFTSHRRTKGGHSIRSRRFPFAINRFPLHQPALRSPLRHTEIGGRSISHALRSYFKASRPFFAFCSSAALPPNRLSRSAALAQPAEKKRLNYGAKYCGSPGECGTGALSPSLRPRAVLRHVRRSPAQRGLPI
jgi:hypothetical protein